MPVHRIEGLADGVRLWFDAATSVESRLPSNMRRRPLAEREAWLRDDLQTKCERRVAKADIPQDDPDLTRDPALDGREDARFDGDDIVLRRVTVASVRWNTDSEAYSPLISRTLR